MNLGVLKKSQFFFCFLENFHLLKGTDRRHIPQESVLDSSSTIKVWSPSHSGFIFFFSILCQKIDHFSDFPIFWHFDRLRNFGYWRYGSKFKSIGSRWVLSYLPSYFLEWTLPPLFPVRKNMKKDTQNQKVASSSKGSNPDPLLPGCGFGRYSNLGNTYIVGF